MAKIENILNSKKFKNLQNASIQGHPVKRECLVASTANINLANAVTIIDGITLEDRDRVLLKNQTDASENGIYQVNEVDEELFLVRANDFCIDSDLENQPIVWVAEGDVGANTLWMLLTMGEIIIDETDLSFVLLSNVSPVLAREYFLAGEYTENIYPKFSDWSLLKTDLEGRFPDVDETHPVIVHRRFNLADGTLISLGADTKESLYALGIRVEDGEGIGGGVTEVTYSELAALISASGLTVGQKYLITDYKSTYTQPVSNISKSGDTEPLLVTAISVNKLSPIAFSAAYPDDIIYYEVANNTNVVPGCTKGYIYRRIYTTNNIDIPFDWRQVTFARWKIVPDTWLIGTTYVKGDVVKSASNTTCYVSLRDNNIGNAVTNTDYWRVFEWNYGDYVSPTGASEGDPYWYVVNDAFQLKVKIDWEEGLNDGMHVFSTSTTNGALSDLANIYDIKIDADINHILYNFNSVFYGNNFYSNSIGKSFSHNSIGNDFYGNSIGNGFYGNSIGNSFYNNSIGNSFVVNSIGYGFCNNSVRNDFVVNSIGYGFCNNSVRNDFSVNSIGYGFCNNSVRNEFSGNSIGNYFSGNSIGNYFSYNSISNYFVYVETIETCEEIDFLTATIVYQGYSKKIIKDADTEILKLLYLNNGVMTIADIDD